MGVHTFPKCINLKTNIINSVTGFPTGIYQLLHVNHYNTGSPLLQKEREEREREKGKEEIDTKIERKKVKGGGKESVNAYQLLQWNGKKEESEKNEGKRTIQRKRRN